jgi:hypothetical protein
MIITMTDNTSKNVGKVATAKNTYNKTEANEIFLTKQEKDKELYSVFTFA